MQVQQFYKPQHVISNSSISRRVYSGLYNCVKPVRIQQKDSATKQISDEWLHVYHQGWRRIEQEIVIARKNWCGVSSSSSSSSNLLVGRKEGWMGDRFPWAQKEQVLANLLHSPCSSRLFLSPPPLSSALLMLLLLLQSAPLAPPRRGGCIAACCRAHWPQRMNYAMPEICIITICRKEGLASWGQAHKRTVQRVPLKATGGH